MILVECNALIEVTRTIGAVRNWNRPALPHQRPRSTGDLEDLRSALTRARAHLERGEAILAELLAKTDAGSRARDREHTINLRLGFKATDEKHANRRFRTFIIFAGRWGLQDHANQQTNGYSIRCCSSESARKTNEPRAER